MKATFGELAIGERFTIQGDAVAILYIKTTARRFRIFWTSDPRRLSWTADPSTLINPAQ